MLYWQPVTEDTNGRFTDVTWYRLQWGQDPQLLNYSLLLTADTLSYRLDDLAPGRWYFELQALNNEDISDPSDRVTYEH